MKKIDRSTVVHFAHLASKSLSARIRQTLLLLAFSLSLCSSIYAQPTNVYTPLVVGGGGGTFTSGNLTANSSTFGIPTTDAFSPEGNLIDAITTNSAQLNGLTLGNGWIEVDYANGFPAGTDAGFVVDKGLLSIALLSNIQISTYATASGGTAVETRGAANLAGLGLGTDREKIGFTTTLPFRRIRITFSGLDLGALLTAPRIYYAEVLIPQAGVAPACNILAPLVQNSFPAVASYGATGLTGTLNNAANISGILNGVSNLNNIVNATTTDFATITSSLNVAGGAYLSVRLLTGSLPRGYYAGFEIENSAILSAGVLNGLSIQVLNDGVPVQSKSGSDLLTASLLSGGTKETIGFLVTDGTQFDEIRINFAEGLLEANVGNLLVYNAVVKSFCAPTAPLTDFTLLANGHPTTNGMGVAVNGDNSGLVGASILGYSQSMDNLVDSDPQNYVEINGSIIGAGVASSASLAVATPAYTFTNDEFVGFIVRGDAGLIDLGLLTGVTITTYNDGVAVETIDNNQLLNLSALGLDVIGGTGDDNVMIIGFKTTGDFDEVQLTVDGLAGAGNGLRVYNAFVSTDAALPVSFGPISAIIRNGQLLVNWSTISETNNKEFIIEVSKDGKTFYPAGTVSSLAPNGNSDAAIEYSFTKNIQEVIKLGGFSILAALLLLAIAGTLVPAGRRKKLYLFTPLLALLIGISITSCSKTDGDVNIPQDEVGFVRIGQKDIDGKTSFSKIVKVVTE